MERPFQLLHQLSGPVVIQTGAHAQRPCVDFEGRDLAAFAPELEGGAQQLVDHRLERPARPAHLGSQRGGDVVFQGQRGPHIMMLDSAHHDVNCDAGSVLWPLREVLGIIRRRPFCRDTGRHKFQSIAD